LNIFFAKDSIFIVNESKGVMNIYNTLISAKFVSKKKS